jgi:hypothetical protein
MKNYKLQTRGALFEKTAPLDPPQKLFIKVSVPSVISVAKNFLCLCVLVAKLGVSK